MCKVVVNCCGAGGAGGGGGGGGGGLLVAGVGVCLMAVAAPVIVAAVTTLIWVLVTAVCVVTGAVVVGGALKGVSGQALDEWAIRRTDRRAALPQTGPVRLEMVQRRQLPVPEPVLVYPTPLAEVHRVRGER